MEWFKDNTKVWILIAVLVVCFFWALSSTTALNKARNDNQSNLVKVMSLEEKYDSAIRAKTDSDEKVKQLAQELEQQKKIYSDTLNELDQEKIAVKALKEEAQKLNDALKEATGKAMVQ